MENLKPPFSEEEFNALKKAIELLEDAGDFDSAIIIEQYIDKKYNEV